MGLIIDNFAGGGGASLGIERALGRSPDAAINHDAEAVAMHTANHPNTRHYCQNIWQVDPRDVVKELGGGPVDLAWFSPDCKHFSKAKGGAPIKKNIRDLAWVVVHWAKLVKPSVIMLENVEEFKTWGPMCPFTNTALKDRAGETWNEWIKALRKEGYQVQWRELRACDYGAPTIRKRLFVIARCDGKPIVWPKPTHGQGLKPYLTAADCIDWSLPCPSIFGRKKPLVENTMVRIAKGFKKFVIDSPKPFIVSYYGPKKDGDFRGQDLNEPLKTQTTENRHAIVTPFIGRICQNGGSGHRGKAIDDPLSTITSKAEHLLVAPHLQRQFGKSVGSDCGEPTPTITAGGGGKTALVSAFIAKHYGGVVGVTIDQPAPTTTTRGTQNQIVTSHMIKMRGTNLGYPTNEPLHTISSGGTHHGEVRAFLMKYYGTGEGAPLNDPMHSVTTKDRFGLVTIEGEDYQIVDIGMRMLQPRELFRAQGFHDTYKIDFDFNGKPLTKTAAVRMCGNSVSPNVPHALVSANIDEAIDQVAAAE